MESESTVDYDWELSYVVKHEGITHFIRLELIGTNLIAWVVREEYSYTIMNTVAYVS